MRDNNKDFQTNDLAKSILGAIENTLKDVHTCLPGIIESFDASTQTVSVQPAIKRIFRQVSEEDEVTLVPLDLPLCINVPVIFPRSGGWALTMPIAAGDECLIVFAERSIDLWHEQGGTKEPNGKRFHDLSDGVCIPGLSSIPKKIQNYQTDAVELRDEERDQYIRLQDNNDLIIKADQVTSTFQASGAYSIINGGSTLAVSAAGAFSFTGTSAVFDVPTASFTGTLSVSGATSLSSTLGVTGATTMATATATTMSIGGINFGSHTHGGVDNGPGNTGGPQ